MANRPETRSQRALAAVTEEDGNDTIVENLNEEDNPNAPQWQVQIDALQRELQTIAISLQRSSRSTP